MQLEKIIETIKPNEIKNYKEEENVWNLRNIAGVVKVNDFCKLNGSKEIHKYTKEKDIKIEEVNKISQAQKEYSIKYYERIRKYI